MYILKLGKDSFFVSYSFFSALTFKIGFYLRQFLVIVIPDVDGKGVMSRQMLMTKWTLKNRRLSVRWVNRDWLDLVEREKG